MLKTIRSLWNCWSAARAKRERRTGTLAYPRLEMLEDRLTPADSVWLNGPPTHDWSEQNAIPWVPAKTPASGDDVYFIETSNTPILSEDVTIKHFYARSAAGNQLRNHRTTLDMKGFDLKATSEVTVFSAAHLFAVKYHPADAVGGAAARATLVFSSENPATVTTAAVRVGADGFTLTTGDQNTASLFIEDNVTVNVGPGKVLVGGKTVGRLFIEGQNAKLKADDLYVRGVNAKAELEDISRVVVKGRSVVALTGGAIVGIGTAPKESPAALIDIDDATVTADFVQVGNYGPGQATVRNGGSLATSNTIVVGDDNGAGTLDIQGNGTVVAGLGLTINRSGIVFVRANGVLKLPKGGLNRGVFEATKQGQTKADEQGLINRGRVRTLSYLVGPGDEVAIAGKYVQTGEGALELEIAGPVAAVNHDRLLVTRLDDGTGGNATLGGKLTPTFTNYAARPWTLAKPAQGIHPETPAVAGDAFLVVSATNSLAGAFDDIDLPAPEGLTPRPGYAYKWVVHYDTTNSYDPAFAAYPVSDQPWLDNTTYDAVLMLREVKLPETTTTLVAAPPTSYPGQSVTFTATVLQPDPDGPLPTGSVSFFVGSTLLTTAPLVPTPPPVGQQGPITAQATFITSDLDLGVQTIRSEYIGDDHWGGSTATADATVEKLASSTLLVADLTSLDPGQSVTFTATVTPPLTDAPTPTGTVVFTDGDRVLATVDLSGGQAAYTTELPAGVRSISVSYSGDGVYLASGDGVAVTAHDSTSTALTATPAAAAFGQTITFTATVTASLEGGVALTGDVDFWAGALFLGSAGLGSDGKASVSTVLDPGTYGVTAVYAGATYYATSTSDAFSVTVARAQPTVYVWSSKQATLPGEPVTFTAAVFGETFGPEVTGSVTFLCDGVALGTVDLSADGYANFTTSSLGLGFLEVVADYSGDDNYEPKSSMATWQWVRKSATSLYLSADPAYAYPGQAVTLTATLSLAEAGGPSPAGGIAFYDGEDLIGTAPVAWTGFAYQATLTTTSLGVGPHALSCEFDEDPTYLGSVSGEATVTVQPIPTATDLSVVVRTTAQGQVVDLFAAVAPMVAGGPGLTGTVTFFAGTDVVGTVTLAQGAALDGVALPPGVHQLSASYGGDAAHGGSASATATVTVRGHSTTALSASTTSALAGDTVTFTATVSPTVPGGPAPSGEIQFLDGPTVIAVFNLTNGSATFSTSGLLAGTHSITARYASGEIYDSSTSPAVAVTVERRTAGFTFAGLGPFEAGEIGVMVWLSVRAGAAGGFLPTGEVSFSLNGSPVGTAQLSSYDGVAYAGVTPYLNGTPYLFAGTYTATAVYGGDNTFEGFTATLVFTIT